MNDTADGPVAAGTVLTFHRRQVLVAKPIIPAWENLPMGPVANDNVQAHAWVLDVLGDLRSFAQTQGLDRLAGVLTECGDIALEEMRLRISERIGSEPQSPEDA